MVTLLPRDSSTGLSHGIVDPMEVMMKLSTKKKLSKKANNQAKSAGQAQTSKQSRKTTAKRPTARKRKRYYTEEEPEEKYYQD